jgi:hypothetical protein
MDLLCDHYEVAILEGRLDPDSTCPEHPEEEQIWLSTSRIGYDADDFAAIEREPELLWFG